MKFKAEIIMLLAAITLFVISTLCYSIGGADGDLALYPYRSWAFPFVSCGSFLMATATLSYSKRSKTI
ncbi:MAG: hypothetical protein ACE14S_02360 [Candidatus Bathyarchaeia archaeon]